MVVRKATVMPPTSERLLSKSHDLEGPTELWLRSGPAGGSFLPRCPHLRSPRARWTPALLFLAPGERGPWPWAPGTGLSSAEPLGLGLVTSDPGCALPPGTGPWRGGLWPQDPEGPGDQQALLGSTHSSGEQGPLLPRVGGQGRARHRVILVAVVSRSCFVEGTECVQRLHGQWAQIGSGTEARRARGGN